MSLYDDLFPIEEDKDALMQQWLAMAGVPEGPEPPAGPDYVEGRHYAEIHGNPEMRLQDFKELYLATSVKDQSTALRTGEMPTPDPNQVILDEYYTDGYYYAYGKNGWGGETPIWGTLSNDILKGGGRDDFIYGDDGDDRIFGKGGMDVLDGGRGNDTIHAGGGNDIVYGGLGDDVIKGGSGDDDLGGGYGDDIIHGGRGNDILLGDHGNDILYGGHGDDHLTSSFSGHGTDMFYGGAGNDSIRSAKGVNQKIYGGTGNDSLGGEGIFYFRVGDGQDRMGGHTLLDGTAKISFEEESGVDSFDDLIIERFDHSVHPNHSPDGGYRIWYSEHDYIDLTYGSEVSLPDAPTEDHFLF